MNNKERGKYIERYILNRKKENQHDDYSRYKWCFNLFVNYCVVESIGESYITYQEWVRWWNPIVIILLFLQIPFIILMNGLQCIPKLYSEIKSLFSYDRRDQVFNDNFKNFMVEHYPNKVDAFYGLEA